MRRIALAVLGLGVGVYVWFVYFHDRSVRPWHEVQQSNSVEGYQGFIRNYPKSQFSQLASNNLNQLLQEQAWLKATNDSTIESFRRFLQTYPKGPFSTLASNELARLAWLRATDEGSVDAFREFLSAFSYSSFAEQARTAVMNLFVSEWATIRLSLRARDYTSFIAKQPPTNLIAEAEFMLRVLDEAAKQGMSDLQAAKAKVVHFEKGKGNCSFSFDGMVRMGNMLVQVLSLNQSQPLEFLSQQETYTAGETVRLVLGTKDGPFGPDRGVVAVLKGDK